MTTTTLKNVKIKKFNHGAIIYIESALLKHGYVKIGEVIPLVELHRKVDELEKDDDDER